MRPLLLCVLALGALQAPAEAQRRSIEELLEEARAARAAETATLRPAVDALLAAILAADADRNQREVERLRRKVVDHGTGAGLVLAELLDPGPNAPLSADRQGREAAVILERMHGAALLPVLLDVAENGSVAGRPRAIGVLGAWPDPAAVGPRLERIYATGRAPDRDAALAALARLGGEAAERVFSSALAAGDPALVQRALLELGRHPDPQLAVLVEPLLADRERCTQFLDPLLDFFAGQPAELTGARAASLVQLVLTRRVSDGPAVALLDRLGTFDLDLRGELDDLLVQLQSWQRRDIAEAASVCRARLGDARALRDLESQYTDRIDTARDKEDPKPYAARAEMYLRVGEPKKAERDFDRAIVLDGAWGGFVDRGLYIGLARAQAQQGRLSQAAKSLEEAQLRDEEIEALAADPDFAALAASRYGGVLSGA